MQELLTQHMVQVCKFLKPFIFVSFIRSSWVKIVGNPASPTSVTDLPALRASIIFGIFLRNYVD